MLVKATKIYAANVRGLVKNLKLINSLNLAEYEVLLLSEIWNIKDFENVKINGFELAHWYQRENRGGGVAIYVKTGMEFTQINGKINIGITEAIGINANGLSIFCIYRPPSGNKNEFINDMCSLMDNNRGRKVILGGDFNINNLVENNVLNDWANTYNLKAKIKGITRPESGSCLDNFYTNTDGNFWISNTSIADHLSIIAEIKTENQIIHKKTYKYRIMKEENWLMFGTSLRRIKITGSSTEEKWENLCKDIKSTIESCFPLKTCKREYTFTMTPGLLKSRDKKNLLLRKYKQGKINKKVYIEYNRIYRKLIIAEKEKEFKQKMELAGTNSKKKWQTLKEELLLTKDREEINKVKINNREITDPDEIAKAFKGHFETCAVDLANNLPNGSPDLSKIEEGDNWTFEKTGSVEIIKIIKELETKNSSGHDLLSNRMLKKEMSWFATILPSLINSSMEEGIFPKVLKKATVIPVFKKGEKDNMNNYRPISLLPVMSKVFEKVINTRITKVLDNKGYIDENQYGFRKNHSTEDAILKFTDEIERDISEKKHVVSVFVDVSKAFDSCDHTILINKIRKIGLYGQSLELIKSYLKDREQIIWVNDKCGGTFKINIGVGQGTILGPTFFKIYIMDLHKWTKLLCVKFADDSNFKGSGKTKDEVEQLVNSEMTIIHKWFCDNKLTLHPGKSRFMVHSRDKLININMGNHPIQRVGYGLQEEAVKFLGLYLDENLDWKIHCKKVQDKIGKGNYLLWRHKNVLTKNTRKTIYESFVRCHLMYCLSIWGPKGIKNQNLVKTWKRIIKKLGPKFRHTNKRLSDYEIMPLSDEVKLAEDKLIWRWEKKDLPQGIMDIIQEKTNLRLRNRKFGISKKWKPDSISFRLNKGANTNINRLTKIKSKKKLTELHKETSLSNLRNIICNTRQCFICAQDHPRNLAAA
jgi:hypothetical protein